MKSEPTIFALASGMGKSAVAVIRISGPKTWNILCAMTTSAPSPRKAALRSIVDPQTAELIDRGLILWFPGPQSFTGEDCAELQVHGSRAVVKALLRSLAAFDGARLALPGEFARRALIHGKMDLIAIEALADLVNAETEQQRRLATLSASGELQGTVETLRHEIVDLMANIETELDFSDEGDLPSDLGAQIGGRILEVEKRLQGLRATHDKAELIRDGLTVLIAGPPNAGKSSLLNSLARRDVAIVSEYAGTTRDLIEVRLDLDGFPVNLIDTAGIRDGLDPIEQEGIKRALTKALSADLVLWLSPIDGPLTEPPEALSQRPLWRVATKIDLDEAGGSTGKSTMVDRAQYSISAKSGNLENLILGLQEFASENMKVEGSQVVANERQLQALDMALEALKGARRPRLPLEFLAEDLRRACFALESLIGKVGVEDLLDSLFTRFCIGK